MRAAIMYKHSGKDETPVYTLWIKCVLRIIQEKTVNNG